MSAHGRASAALSASVKNSRGVKNGESPNLLPRNFQYDSNSLAVTGHNGSEEQLWETRVARKTRKKASNSR